MKNRILSALLLTCMLLGLSACAGKQDDAQSQQSPEADQPVAFCLGARPESLDPAHYAIGDDATYLVNLFSGLVAYRTDGEGQVGLTADLCTELPEPTLNEDGKPVYAFRLRDGLKWSDGSPLTAADLVYSWNRAAGDPDASERDLFSCIDGFEDGTLNITASEDGSTFTVVLCRATPRFFQRLANPVFFPVKEDAVQMKGWDLDPERCVTSGAYRLAEFSEASMILARNDAYWDADSTVLDKLPFRFSESASEILAAYNDGEIRVAAGLPVGSTGELSESEGEALHVTGRMGSYALCFNMNDPALAAFSESERADIRTALGLLIDRNAICEDIAKQGQRPAASIVPEGMTDADGSAFSDHNGPDGSGGGYYSVSPEDYEENCKRAVELLRGAAKSSGAFKVSKDGVCKDFPELTYLTSDSTGHVEIANALAECFKAYGITLNISALSQREFLKARETGAFSMARFSWTAAYDDPASFLSLWTAGAGSNCIGIGQDDHGSYAGYAATIGGSRTEALTWAESYNALLFTAAGSTDETLRCSCMHEAETLLMQTGAICPIYEYTCVYLCRPSFRGLYTGPSGAMYFMRASA